MFLISIANLDYSTNEWMNSGNLTADNYQNGQPDAWHHAYEYDADNRITAVYTSTYKDAAKPEFSPFSFTGAAFWEEDVRYHYYHHGSLARIELGENNVQGVDFSFLISGWLKGINSETLLASRDMGKDGNSGTNQHFAKDAFGFSLGYFENDYTPINATATFLADKTGSDLQNNTANLYNGIISSMVTTIVPPTLSAGTVTYAVTSVASSFLFKNAFTASVVGSGGGFTFNGGYNGFGVRPLLSLSTEIGIGTVSGLGFNLAHSRIVFTGSALGDFSTGVILGVQFNSLGIVIPNAIIKQNELEK